MGIFQWNQTGIFFLQVTKTSGKCFPRLTHVFLYRSISTHINLDGQYTLSKKQFSESRDFDLLSEQPRGDIIEEKFPKEENA